MITGDLHIHSIYSNGYFRNLPPWVASTPEEILKKAKERGLKVVAIADHDSLEGSRQAAKIAKEYGLIVISACEVTSVDGHILAYGIRKEIPKKLSAMETIKLIHNQSGLAIAAHPFRNAGGFFRLTGLNGKIFSLPLDGLEVANAHQIKEITPDKIVKAKKLKLTEIGGSDSHQLDFIGFGVTIFKDEVKTAADVLEAIKKRETEAKVIHYVPLWRRAITFFRDQFKFILRHKYFFT